MKASIVRRQGTEEGRTRLDRFNVIICINSKKLQVQFICHFLPVSSGFHFHAQAFCSLFRVFIAQPTVNDVRPARGYNAVAVQCDARSHLLRTNRHPLPTKYVEGGKGEILWAHTYPTVSSRPRGRCGKVWFRSVQKCGFV